MAPASAHEEQPLWATRVTERVNKGHGHGSRSYDLLSAQSELGPSPESNHNHEEEPLKTRGSHSQEGTELDSEPACPKACPPPARGDQCWEPLTPLSPGLRTQEPCTLARQPAALWIQIPATRLHGLQGSRGIRALLAARRSLRRRLAHVLGLGATHALGPESGCYCVHLEGSLNTTPTEHLRDLTLLVCKSPHWAGRAARVERPKDGVLAGVQKGPCLRRPGV